MTNLKPTLILLAMLLVPVGFCWADAADPSLIGWWQMEDEAGTVAVDSSGNDRDGTLMGRAEFVTGMMTQGQALQLNGNPDHLRINGFKGVLGTSAFSVAAWVNYPGTNGAITSWGPVIGKQCVGFRLDQGRLRVEHNAGNRQGDTVLNDGEWHHVALTVVENATMSHPETILYLDGQDDTRPGTDPDPYQIVADPNIDFVIGVRMRSATWLDRYSRAQFDDVRLYNRTLSADEVQALAFRPDAHSANPKSGSMVAATSVTLSWKAGGLATSHNVYFDANEALVAAGDASVLTSTPDTSMTLTDLLPGTTYYWRVDEVNPDEADSPWAGPVWSFWIPPKEAYDTYPPDNATHAPTNTQLSWAPGLDAIGHWVAFGTDRDEVAGAQGSLIVQTNTFDPGELALGTTYYWRVDAMAPLGSAPGQVMSFTTLSAADADMPPAADTDLIGWWKADEPATALMLLDHSGNDLHGVLEGNAQYVDGVMGGAVELDGRATYRTVAAPNTAVEAATLSAWIRPSGLSGGVQGLVFWRGSKTSGLNLRGGNEVGYHWNNDSLTWGFVSGLIAPQGEWSFTALVIEAEEARLYLNDVNAPAVNVVPHASSPFDGPMNLGRDPQSADRSFPGALDDMRFYQKALSADELSAIMQSEQ